MSLYQFFARASKRSDLPDPSGPLSASLSPAVIKEANEARILLAGNSHLDVFVDVVYNSPSLPPRKRPSSRFEPSALVLV